MKRDLLAFAFVPDYNQVISVIEFRLLRLHNRRSDVDIRRFKPDFLQSCQAVRKFNKPVEVSVL
jgi:hypothetical protein